MASVENVPPPNDMSESERLDDDIARLEAENAAMEAKLQLNSRASYIAASEATAEEEDTASGENTEEEQTNEPITMTEVVMSPVQPPMKADSPDESTAVAVTTPLVEMLQKLLGGFCIPCQTAQQAA